MKKIIFLVCMTFSLLFADSNKTADKNETAMKPKIDPDTGLIIAKGFDEVAGNCLACHNSALITGQKGDRQTWLEIIRWMQAGQGLWKFEPDVEDAILTYLSTNYPDSPNSTTITRRAILSSDKLPK